MQKERRHNVLSDKKKLSGSRKAKRRTSVAKKASSTLDRVREGVRRFILNDVSIGDFHQALRTAVRKGELSPNPLTGKAFRKIVSQVMREQKQTVKKTSRG